LRPGSSSAPGGAAGRAAAGRGGRVLELGAAAVVLALLGVPYRLVVGPAFIAAILAVLVSART